MGGTHGHSLYQHGHSPVHGLAPEAKIAGLVVFVLAVVSTPRSAFWAFAVDGVLVLGVAVVAGISVPALAKRLIFELPFLLFAFFLPIIGQGERVEVLGVSFSVAGLWGAWNILVKGTLGVAASVVLASTTTVPELLRGLDRLRMPKVVTGIMGFMIRYGEVITDELHRMKVARQSRGYDPRWIWQARAVAASAGALFIRSFERGERVHVAMLARGYTGTLPDTQLGVADERGGWAVALAVPSIAVVVAVAAWVLS